MHRVPVCLNLLGPFLLKRPAVTCLSYLHWLLWLFWFLGCLGTGNLLFIPVTHTHPESRKPFWRSGQSQGNEKCVVTQEKKKKTSITVKSQFLSYFFSFPAFVCFVCPCPIRVLCLRGSWSYTHRMKCISQVSAILTGSLTTLVVWWGTGYRIPTQDCQSL